MAHPKSGGDGKTRRNNKNKTRVFFGATETTDFIIFVWIVKLDGRRRVCWERSIKHDGFFLFLFFK